jgi:Transglycosylase SLT domain
MTQYTYAQLEGLWIQANGPKSLAPLMAAIAEAESSGNSQAQNPSGATGLWQILGNPFPGNAMDPLTNARMAVAKWRSQGLGAWTTYTSGAYKQFLHGSVPPATPGGGQTGPTTTTSIFGWPGEIMGFFTTAGTAIDWLIIPSHQIRIFCGVFGIGTVLAGMWILSHVGGDAT